MELIEKSKKTSTNGVSKHRIYYVNGDGEPVKKVCYECEEIKHMDKFGKGSGLLGVHNICNDCILDEAINTSNITVRGLNLLEKELEKNPELWFAPKYDREGRRQLFFYEKDDFKQIALKHGWKAAREKYDLNHFFYGLLRKEMFTKEEIKTADKITPKAPKKKQPAPYKDYELTITDYEYINSKRCIWLEDEEGSLFFINNRFQLPDIYGGLKVRFTAKVKKKRTHNGKAFTHLFMVKNDSIQTLPGGAK